ncbi:hypothetical protein EYZ11_003323 [Aspergillus tanneri]|uniref:Uncharacterized protein n=1 Tax=Aspergillus tanneri TaxID=1220188 RepID=A0A4V3UQ06_9EURO|nr:uncharacterized protein ATNIH1004_001756 [Aspergillus tanneri]KAA8652847.1 hypothetical protein ATNIH1004_001756 [Aspergillus tanneri]THC97214.1 hypothetical protein EYZ11_003323 [Aspergillus tanneri]
MVSLSDIHASNACISSSFPPGLVALFVGATSGIGAATLKTFAKYAHRPRAYFVGRSQEAADRIVAECQTLNPEGEYIFIRADVSLIRVVDEVCMQIQTRESHLNVLFLTAGVPSLDRSETSEKLHLLASLNYYSRLRFMTRLLPLLTQAAFLRRVVTVGGGGLEGPLDSSDFSALRVPDEQLRGHLCTMITLGVEAVARSAPEVAFIHNYPGGVDTPLARRQQYVAVSEAELMSPEESGERQLYLVTSARYAPLQGTESMLSVNGAGRATGTTGEIGSGMYSVGWDGESTSSETLAFLAGLRETGIAEQVWEHTKGEFMRITL